MYICMHVTFVSENLWHKEPCGLLHLYPTFYASPSDLEILSGSWLLQTGPGIQVTEDLLLLFCPIKFPNGMAIFPQESLPQESLSP